MKIGIDARSLHEKQPSGVSFFAYNLIKALVHEYPNDEFVLFQNSLSISTSHLSFESRNNVRVVSRRIPSKLLHASFSFFGKPSFEKLLGPCDVYYFPNVHFLPVPPSPSVITIHDISYIETPDLYAWKNSAWYRFIKARTRIQQMNKIIADSQATAFALQDAFPRVRDKVSVLYPAPTPIRQVKLSEPTHLLLLGDVDERKNVDGALKAYAKIREEGISTLPLVIAGKRGYGSLRTSTQHLLRSLVSKGWVEELGYISEKEKLNLLTHARAVLFVSHYEGFGFPGLEAEALGIPLIASQRTSLPEVLGEGPIYIDSRNWHSIVEALRIVLRSDFPRTTIYKNPLLTRTWSDVAHDMMNVFRSVV